MYVPDGVGDAVTVAVFPEHTVGLFTVTVGVGFTTNCPLTKEDPFQIPPPGGGL